MPIDLRIGVILVLLGLFLVAFVGKSSAQDSSPKQPLSSAVDSIPALSAGAASALRVCEQQRERSERDALTLAHAFGEADASAETRQKQITMYQTTVKGLEAERDTLAAWWKAYSDGIWKRGLRKCAVQ
jgi:hypothetical protein